jgi:PAS domain S-box-containing protein
MRSTVDTDPPAETSESRHGWYYAALVESTHDAIISKNLNGVIQSWNPAAQKIFGYTAEEAIGKPVMMLIPEGHENEEPEILSRIRRGEKVDHYETVRKRKDGTLINISLTVSPIKNGQGEIIGASKIARDITEQKESERAMHQARQELAVLNRELDHRVQERTASLNHALAQMEEFSYSVSHDLRSPARAMQAYATAVLDDYGHLLDSVAQGYLRKIIRSSARMDKLVVDLLAYSRIARIEMEIQETELEPLIQDIMQQYPELQPPRSRIVIRSPLPRVMAHEASITQVLSNLLSNAVKFVAPGTTAQVEIKAEPAGGKVRIWITDNGIGIKPEHQLRLFGMFERGNADARYEGTGIGLAIVRKAIERMNGTVGVESKGTAGSSFWIELPAATG